MFTAVGIHNYYKEQREVMARMETQVEMVKLRASTVLPSLIWNFTAESITDFAKAELRSEFVSGLIIGDTSEILFSGVKGINDELTFEPLSNFDDQQKQLSFKLVHVDRNDENDVGHVSIRYNERYLTQRLDNVLWQQVTQSAVYCLVLFMLIWALINRLVLIPLVKLNHRLDSITYEISQR